jgi:hypothetical protein
LGLGDDTVTRAGRTVEVKVAVKQVMFTLDIGLHEDHPPPSFSLRMGSIETNLLYADFQSGARRLVEGTSEIISTAEDSEVIENAEREKGE